MAELGSEGLLPTSPATPGGSRDTRDFPGLCLSPGRPQHAYNSTLLAFPAYTLTWKSLKCFSWTFTCPFWNCALIIQETGEWRYGLSPWRCPQPCPEPPTTLHVTLLVLKSIAPNRLELWHLSPNPGLILQIQASMSTFCLSCILLFLGSLPLVGHSLFYCFLCFQVAPCCPLGAGLRAAC